MQLTNKVAIVTGASSGVGAAAAIKLAQQGAKVVVNYAHNAAGAERTAEQISSAGGQALVVQADVSDDSACRAMVRQCVAQFGRLDVLINNAGTTTYVDHAQLDALTDAIWHKVLGTNLLGPFYMCRAAIPEMKKQGGGEIVMTTSIAAISSMGSSIAYGASKAALNSMILYLAKTFGPDNIRVNGVAPGLIDGDWGREGWGEMWQDIKQHVQNSTPIHIVPAPEDIADGLLSIITGSDLLTGQVISLDAGASILRA